jgi:hypothetical protein
MKKLLLLFFLFISFSSFSQKWAPIGAKWHFSHGYGWAPYKLYHSFEAIKDTAIQGRNATKCFEMRKNSIDSVLSQKTIFFHDTLDRLYYLNNSSWYLLYDFTKNAGDTIFYPWNDYTVSTDSFKFYTIVDSTYFVNINGVQKKAQYLHQGADSIWHHLFLDWFGGEVIEGIGRINHSFFPTPHNSDHFEYEPRCYEDSIIGTFTHTWFSNYYPSSNCDDVIRVSISDAKEDIIKLFPNPSSGNITIEISNYSIQYSHFRIYNLQGKLLLDKPIENEKQHIDLESLNSGIYFYEINFNGELIRDKLIKEN